MPVKNEFRNFFKSELVHHGNIATREQARLVIFEWLEVFYNPDTSGLHSTLDYKSLVDFENQLN